MATTQFKLHQNEFGRLILTRSNWGIFEGVFPVRAFPLQASNQYISIIAPNGEEVAWIDKLTDLSPEVQKIISEELESRQFMPEIQSIEHVSSYRAPCRWVVRTNKGETCFTLLENDDLQEAGTNSVVIIDSHRIHYLIRDISALNQYSQKIIERFG